MAGGQRSDTLPRDIESQIRDSRFEIREPLGRLDKRVLLHIYVFCTSTHTGESHAGTPEQFLCHCVRYSSGLSTKSKSVKSKAVLGWWWCCVHMHTPWAACNRSPISSRCETSTQLHNPHPHAQLLPVASCQLLSCPVLCYGYSGGIRSCTFPLSLLLLPFCKSLSIGLTRVAVCNSGP